MRPIRRAVPDRVSQRSCMRRSDMLLEHNGVYTCTIVRSTSFVSLRKLENVHAQLQCSTVHKTAENLPSRWFCICSIVLGSCCTSTPGTAVGCLQQTAISGSLALATPRCDPTGVNRHMMIPLLRESKTRCMHSASTIPNSMSAFSHVACTCSVQYISCPPRWGAQLTVGVW